MTPHAKHTPLDSLRFMVASDPIGTIYCPYPADGGKAHPVCRPDEGPAA